MTGQVLLKQSKWPNDSPLPFPSPLTLLPPPISPHPSPFSLFPRPSPLPPLASPLFLLRSPLSSLPSRQDAIFWKDMILSWSLFRGQPCSKFYNYLPAFWEFWKYMNCKARKLLAIVSSCWEKEKAIIYLPSLVWRETFQLTNWNSFKQKSKTIGNETFLHAFLNFGYHSAFTYFGFGSCWIR